MNAKEIRVYRERDGFVPFDAWLEEVKDAKSVQIILTRMYRVALGNFGDCRFVGAGVFELRIHFGPGYRVYFGQDGLTVVILLCGGMKRTQSKDIKAAQSYWIDYKRRKK